MAPFVTGVAGCTCPRCIAPHEFWDRATPPPIEGFVEGRFVTEPVVTTPQTVVPPMGTPPANVAIPPQPIETAPTVTFPIVPLAEPQREVQIVRVGTPLADVIGLPGNPFLD